MSLLEDWSFYNIVLALSLLVTVIYSLVLLLGPDDDDSAAAAAAATAPSPRAAAAASSKSAAAAAPPPPPRAPYTPPEESPLLSAGTRGVLDACLAAAVLASVLSVLAYEGGGDPLTSLAALLPQQTSTVGRALSWLRSTVGLL